MSKVENPVAGEKMIKDISFGLLCGLPVEVAERNARRKLVKNDAGDSLKKAVDSILRSERNK